MLHLVHIFNCCANLFNSEFSMNQTGKMSADILYTVLYQLQHILCHVILVHTFNSMILLKCHIILTDKKKSVIIEFIQRFTNY